MREDTGVHMVECNIYGWLIELIDEAEAVAGLDYNADLSVL